MLSLLLLTSRGLFVLPTVVTATTLFRFSNRRQNCPMIAVSLSLPRKGLWRLRRTMARFVYLYFGDACAGTRPPNLLSFCFAFRRNQGKTARLWCMQKGEVGWRRELELG